MPGSVTYFEENKKSCAIIPPLGDRMVLPAAFGRRFVIFADAEEEFDWSMPLRRENDATTAIAGLIEATQRFNAAGAVPSYLVDYPVVNKPSSANVIAELVKSGAADVGTQLHPWVSPPFEEDVTQFNSFAGNLPVALEQNKLLQLTDKIEIVTGVRPTTYRAGRYGLGPNTIALLTKAGYEMDVSVRARFDYSNLGGRNYTQHPVWPWRLNDSMIEVPLSTAWTGAMKGSPRLFDLTALRGTLARTQALSRVPLTPEGVPVRHAIKAIRTLFDEGLQIFSMYFHTPSVIPGHTPYVRSNADLLEFWRWWDGVFNECAKLGILPVRQDEIIAAARGQ